MQPERAAHRSYHYLPLSTTLVVDEVDSSGFRQSSLQIGSLLSIAKEETAVARAIRAFLWITGEVKEAHFQVCVNGLRYLELCPSYLSTLDGVTRWAAREAWSTCFGIIGWVEYGTKVAASLGARLRDLSWGQRWGRHMFLTEQQHQALLLAARSAREQGLLSEYEAYKGSTGVGSAVIKSFPWGNYPGKRTVAVPCPFPHNHKNSDRTPSLVLWRPNRDGVGGALCMVCKTHHGAPVAWAVRYHQDEAVLYATRAEPMEPKTTLQAPHTRHRHNKHPIGGIGGPIGGCVGPVLPQQSGCFVGARLDATRCGHSLSIHRSSGSRLSGNPLVALRWSDSRSRGDAAADRAAFVQWVLPERADVVSEEWLSTRLCSVSTMAPKGWVDTRNGPMPIGWSPKRQGWVLLDLDGIDALDAVEQSVGEAVSRVVRRDQECSGRLAVVRTGPVGLQVWVELREVRHSPTKWHRNPNVISWYADLGKRVLCAVRALGATSGLVDSTSCAAGRFGRRPGWRLLEDGSLFRSRLLHSEESPVVAHAPRYP